MSDEQGSKDGPSTTIAQKPDSRDWMTMGVGRSEDGASVRRRRMSKTMESINIPEADWNDLAPGARVMFLLKNKNDIPALFTEMSELTRSAGTEEWKETARWVKFEEDVEEGGNRWSKPHVATLSLHALFQLRSCLLHGVVLIDVEAETLPELTEQILQAVKKTNQLDENSLDGVRHVLNLRHTHQYEQAKRDGSTNGSNQGGFLSAVRSISDIGRSFSHGKNLSKHSKDGGETDESNQGSPKKSGAHLELPKVGSVPKDLPREGSHSDVSKGNMHFFKKLPPGAEATSVLVGEVDFLDHHVTIFARLKNANIMGDLAEVPIPTRFAFILLGPKGHGTQFKEIGRAIATLMADEIFHDVAYKARDRSDLLDGVDEFLDQVTVLPPGEWDPKIRIEPPTCFATFCFMYFALLAPIVTFGGLLEEATHQRMAAMENLASGAVCGIIYHLFSGQPLTIIGSTGPVLVFETIVFDLSAQLGLDYLSFRAWIHIWTAIILMIMVITDASSLVSYITRFTEESFATLIAVIFIYEAIMKWIKIKDSLDIITYTPPGGVKQGLCRCSSSGASMEDIIGSIPLTHCSHLLGKLEGDCYVLYDKWLMSLVLMIGTFFLAITFKKMRNSCYFPSKVRQVFSDFAVMIAIAVMTALDLVIGINTPKLNVPSSFRPTWEGRGWFVPPFNGNPIWTAPLAAIPALLACILIFMDQQITTVIVNRKENKLKKGCGYHLDLFVLAILIVIVGFLGLPVYVAATVLSINHVNSLKVESESRAPGEVPQFIGVREQRVTGIITFLFIGLSVFMTNILGNIPMPVLYGVFLYMGIAALGGIQLFDRILLMLMPMKYQPDAIYIRHVPIKTIHKYTICQFGCLAVLWIVKSIKKTSIAFPIMLVVMVGVRKVMEKFFNEKDLKYLDDKMPDFHLRKKEDLKKINEGEAEEIEIDLDENQGTIHAVKTEAHLHIPMASGNVIKIPLAAIQEPSHNINISKEVNSSGMWRHITNESKTSLQKFGQTSDREVNSPRLATPEEPDDEDAIVINIQKPSPDNADRAAEQIPLLKKRETKSPESK
ncbi:hypothetical protein FO519_006875 [Halicephalobus sp. NKZ332]|nr:hypothetical protein FO519_006875 [Halicephalobus sp. NKZ332]